MATLVLLNDDGTVFRKLNLVSLPDDYQVPEDKLVSWQMFFETSSREALDALRGPTTPMLSYFYLGSAWAEMKCNGWRESIYDGTKFNSWCYGICHYTLTVQGKVAKDVVALRDRVLEFVRGGKGWGVRNDLNPRPRVSIWRKLFSR
jgi:hypothetical protein